MAMAFAFLDGIYSIPFLGILYYRNNITRKFSWSTCCFRKSCLLLLPILQFGYTENYLPIRKYLFYFLIGTAAWILYLCSRTLFQIYYLRSERGFQGNPFADIFISNLTFIIVCFLFITACKYFKDGYITQQFETQKKQEQLIAEVNNLKSQIAPHFLFNTLNNLYGLAVEKSDKLPDLMLRLSDLLRHSLYETQKPLVPLDEEIKILKSYIQLESVRLEDDLKLEFHNTVPEETPYQIAPLILIVFMENAFKHAKLIKTGAVDIFIKTTLEDNWFSLTIKNNYNQEKKSSPNGIGLTNVKRRLEVLYPNQQHQLANYPGRNFLYCQFAIAIGKWIKQNAIMESGKYNCLVVDDEPIARKIIINYIEQMPILALAAESINALNAIDYLRTHHNINIIFLDINMPNLSGLQLLKIVAATTAHHFYNCLCRICG